MVSRGRPPGGDADHPPSDTGQPRRDGWRGALRRAGLDLLTHLEGMSNAPPPPPPPPDVSRLAGEIRYGTLELACLHEAGHVAAAFAARAQQLRAEVEPHTRPPGGRIRVRRSADQRPTIAVGGFAVELQLWRDGRLRWFDGSWVSDADMRCGAARSAQDDRAMYFGGDQRSPDGRWPAAMDDAFYRAADDLRAELDFGFVRRTARALFTQLSLREREIARLATTPLFADGLSTPRARLALRSGLQDHAARP